MTRDLERTHHWEIDVPSIIMVELRILTRNNTHSSLLSEIELANSLHRTGPTPLRNMNIHIDVLG